MGYYKSINVMMKAMFISKVIKPHLMIVLGVLLLTTSNTTLAQSKDSVLQAMEKAHKGNFTSLGSEAFYYKDPRQAAMVLSELKKYHNDPSSNVRLTAHHYEYKIGLENTDLGVRRAVVNSLSNVLIDKDPYVAKNAAKLLITMKSNDFSSDTKSLISELFSKEESNEHILLIGAAGLVSKTQKLEEIIINNSANDTTSNVGKWYGKKTWAAHLALARLGSQKDVQYCIRRVEEEGDEVIKVTRLLKDIAYIRNDAAVEFLHKYLESEERLPSIVQNMPGTKICVYALDLLAQIIEGFPIKSKGIGYSSEEIRVCRDWMRSNVNYKIDK